MQRSLQAGISYLAIVFVLDQSFMILRGQQRLPDRIDPQKKAILRGSRNFRIQPLVSGGAVEDSMRVSGITFRFKPAPEQQVDLEKLLADQQNPSSPLYHAWLTPQEYGERFGLNPYDYSIVREWIASQGFQIDYAARSRTHISFSGTAGQVRKAFGTELHYYRLGGRKHFANASEVEIPSAFESLVYTIRGLDDFPEERAGTITRATDSNTGAHGLTPGDLAVIYNLNPLYQQGITGAGQKIVVAGQSGFNLQDVRRFREAMGMPPNDPKIILMPGVRDPGLNGALPEALLDVEFAGGVAPGAAIVYVYGPDAARAVEYAVDQNLAPVISYSFSACEKQNTAHWGWFRNVVQQAAVQGITWVAASGNTGPAGCESQLRDAAGVNGFAVNLPAGVPEVTAVGGTEFAEGNANYWSSTNARNGTSARSYIPEKAWNDTAPGRMLAAGGGGASAAFPRPDWQTGPGVPDDNARHVPDIAFTASWDHDPYLIMMSGDFATTGGTSAGTPFFAGVLALLNEYLVRNGMQAGPGLGNINPRLYLLAQNSPGVFHDITAGDNIIPCRAGTPDCATGQYGYNAGPGYDHVTGLGSIDIAKLFEAWRAGTPNRNPAANVVVSVEPSPVYKQAPDRYGHEWLFTIHVSETGGAAARIKALFFDGDDLSGQIADWFGSVNLPAGGSLSAELGANDLEVPSDHVFTFSGTDSGGNLWSQQVSVTFLGEKSGAAMSLTANPAVVMKEDQGDPNCPADHPFYQPLILKERNGTAVNLNKFVAEGFDFTDRIASWFGSARLPALGALQAGLCWAIERTPAALFYEIGGVDETGQFVQATLKAGFMSMDDKSGIVPAAAGSFVSAPAEPALTTPPSIQGADVTVRPLRFKPALANRRK